MDSVLVKETLNPFEIAQKQFDTAAEKIGLEDGMREVLRNPKRQLVVSIPTLMDDGTVKVRSVVEPSAEMFCTIISTLMLASASGPKIAAATPGLSGTWRIEICASSFENAMPVTTCCSMISLSSQISVPGG